MYAFTEVLIPAMPFRILHAWAAWLFGIVYVIFSIVYWLLTDNIIYYLIDYKHHCGYTIGFILLSTVVIIVCQLFLFCFYWLRVIFFRGCINTDAKAIDPETQIILTERK